MYGIPAFAKSVSDDILEDLLAVYDNNDAVSILVMAILRIMVPGISGAEYAEYYRSTFLRVFYPGARLSESRIGSLESWLGARITVQDLSLHRKGSLASLKDTALQQAEFWSQTAQQSVAFPSIPASAGAAMLKMSGRFTHTTRRPWSLSVRRSSLTQLQMPVILTHSSFRTTSDQEFSSQKTDSCQSRSQALKTGLLHFTSLCLSK